MVQLRSCYFCGTTEALSEYETLPSDLRGQDASQRVVLCDRCHTKLTNVLTPIVERFEDTGGPRDAPSPGGTAADDGTDATSEPDPKVGPSDDESSQTDVTFTGVSTPSDAESSPETATDLAPRDRSPADEHDEAGSSAAEAEPSPAAAASTTDAGDADDASDTVDGDGEASDRPADESDGTDTTETRGESADDAPDDPDTESVSTDDEPPARDDLDRVYHKLLRFLRNREFPIPREEAEAVAQSAYDLTASEAAEVIGRAVDRGVLEERDGELHRS